MSAIDLLTEEQAAERLLISPRSLHALRKAGQIRYVQLTARKIAYRPEDCDEYVAARVRIALPRSESSSGPRRTKGRTGLSAGVVVPFSQRAKAGR